jgi:hypothetical protein
MTTPNMLGSSAPPPPYSLVPPPLNRSWLDRHGRWKVLLGCLVAIFLLCAFVAAIFTVVDVSFRNSTVYQEALACAGKSSQVNDRIGNPLRPGRILSGELNVSGSTGTATMRIPITGPRGKGSIVLDARKVDGTWIFRTLEVQIEGQSDVVNLLDREGPSEQ